MSLDYESDGYMDSGSDFEAAPAPAPKPRAPRKRLTTPKVAAKPKAASNAPSKENTPQLASQDSPNATPDSGNATPATETESPPDKPNVQTQYQKLSQLEHILKRPDTYVGLVVPTEVEMWTYDDSLLLMVYKEVKIVPGLYKIFDEILVNAADNKIRDPLMKMLKVLIDPAAGTVVVRNDGKGIPIAIHEKEQMYIPEMIFGNLLTSSNYDDDQKKVTGGRNGYGAKLCNIFSREFVVETADLEAGKVYRQVWTNNMTKCGKPQIRKMTTKREYTQITFTPDFSKFGIDGFDADMLLVMRRRVYDLAGTVRDCSVFLNDVKLGIKLFKQYVDMYVLALQAKHPAEEDDAKAGVVVYEEFGKRWEIAFAVSDGLFHQVSFVNSIATTEGGAHVKYVTDQVVKQLTETISNRRLLGKKKLMVKPQEVRNNMFLFVNCLIENPAFTSQTKENMTTKPLQFGSKPGIGEDFIKKLISKTSIVDKLHNLSQANEDKALSKQDGSRRLRVKLAKLHDANKAGTREGYKCTLILTEGDSALAQAVVGLKVVGSEYYGCFPLRGKMLNVREALAEQISKNAEINEIKKIIGLQHKKKYTPELLKQLRYGHILIMTDQDHDGSHIKGLLINFFESSFPGLLQCPGFLQGFITPIVKVVIGGRHKKTIPFYNMPDFERWRELEEAQTTRWTHKYYKGLGTSLATEITEYFQQLLCHLKRFHALEEEDKQYIDLAFNKKKADDRKDWLGSFIPGTQLDPTIEEIPIADFINKELILFSMADNIRSIPCVLDGLKPAQRKVIYGLQKRPGNREGKVNDLAGYISLNTAYHHGDQLLVMTIVLMAQDFVGSNNLNLLFPLGNFGSRMMGGKDLSAPRYIHTRLSDITNYVFNPMDNQLYTYVQEDELTVEPAWYLPVLPMILVNGADGIGTGWATQIPPFNPKDITDNLIRLMDGQELVEMTPWFRGFTGRVEKELDARYKMFGRIEQVDETTLEISEIPAKMWVNPIKEWLENNIADRDNALGWIKDVQVVHSNETDVGFKIILTQAEMSKSLQMGLYTRFKLVQNVALLNMVAFDATGRIKRYNTPLDIIKDYYYVRLEYYQKRKDAMTANLQHQLMRLTEQARFIKLIIEGKIKVLNRKRRELFEILESNGFTKFDRHGKPVDEATAEVVEAANDDESDPEELEQEAQELMAEHVPETKYTHYDYLLGMLIWSLTKEKYEKLLRQKGAKEEELDTLLGKLARDLWKEDLAEFLVQWDKLLDADQDKRDQINGKGKKKGGPRKKRSADDDDDDYGAPKKKAARKPAAKKVKKEPSPAVKTEKPPKTPVPVAAPVKKEPDVLSFFTLPETKKPAKRSAAAAAPPASKSAFDSDSDDLMEIDGM